jgi:hypothetical protein
MNKKPSPSEKRWFTGGFIKEQNPNSNLPTRPGLIIRHPHDRFKYKSLNNDILNQKIKFKYYCENVKMIINNNEIICDKLCIKSINQKNLDIEKESEIDDESMKNLKISEKRYFSKKTISRICRKNETKPKPIKQQEYKPTKLHLPNH